MSKVTHDSKRFVAVFILLTFLISILYAAQLD